MKKMKSYQFTNELSERAMKVYSNSDFVFYKDGETYFCADNQNAAPYHIGTLEDVEAFLMEFAEDEEE